MGLFKRKEKSLAGLSSPAAATAAGGILADIMNPAAIGSQLPRRGTRDILDFYARSPVLHMVGSKIADMVSTVSWSMFVASGEDVTREFFRIKALDLPYRHNEMRALKDSGELKRVTGHPLLTMIRSGNPFMLGRNVRKLMMNYWDLVGETVLLLDRNATGAPFQWFPVSPPWIEKMPTVAEPFYRIRFGGVIREIPEKDVLCIRNPNPLDPYGRGLGVGHVLADELETDESAAKYVNNFFRNGATPPIIVSSPELNPSAVKRAEIDWMQRMGGFLRSFLPYFMKAPEGTTITEMNSSFRDRQVVELRKHERDFALQVFGISPEIFGILVSSNRATIIEARNIVADFVLIPRLELWREAFQERLVPEYPSRNLLIDYDNPAPEDEANQLAAGRIAPFAAKVNEHRERQGLSRLEGDDGDFFLVQPGQIPIRSFAELEEKLLLQAQQESSEAAGIPEEEN
jgi:HK97 family phage portal protein